MRLSPSSHALLIICSLLVVTVRGDRVFGTSINNHRMDHTWRKQNLSGRQPMDETRSTFQKISRGGAAKKEDQGGSSILASVFNLVNNVAGAGILTLSAGMAGGTGWVPAISICTILGAISAHCFAIIGESCELTGEKTFKVRTLVCVLGAFLSLSTFSLSSPT